jgi:acyl-CoA hydrolase
VVVKVTEARLTYVAVATMAASGRFPPRRRPSTAVACQRPADKEVVLQVMPMPAALNPSGDVFGGWIMSMVDIAAAVPAMRHAKSKVATVSVDSFVFKQPVSVGDLVSFHAAIVEVGHTCVTVDVEVFAQRNPAHPEVVKVTGAAQVRRPRRVPRPPAPPPGLRRVEAAGRLE